MQIKIEGLDEIKKSLGAHARQLPFALSKAINDTMSGAHKAVVNEIRDVFDRSTPVVQKGVRWSASTKRNLTAEIYLAKGGGYGPDIASILAPHITGEDRIVKASERRLKSHGWMGQGQWMVPGPNVPLDNYGNISGATMKKILAQLDAFRELGYNKMSRKAAKRGIGTVYGIPFVGVFKRTGPNTSVPLLFFTYTRPKYEAGRFDFYYVIQKYVEQHFQQNFNKAIDAAIRTAR